MNKAKAAINKKTVKNINSNILRPLAWDLRIRRVKGTNRLMSKQRSRNFKRDILESNLSKVRIFFKKQL